MVEKEPNKVWTLVDGDNGHIYVTEGFHFVNRIGYFITEVAADPKDQYSIRADS